MKPSYASSGAIGLRAPSNRRRPSATARSCVVFAAGLIAAFAPATAGAADLDQLADIADQVQATVWSQASDSATGTSAPQSAEQVAQTVAQVTHAALGTAESVVPEAAAPETPGAIAAAAAAATLADTAETAAVETVIPRAPPRAAPSPNRRPVSRTRRPAPSEGWLRPHARVLPPAPSSWPAVRAASSAPPERHSSTRPHSGTARTRPAAAAHGSQRPTLPFRVPSLPLPPSLLSPPGAGSGDGPPVPPLLVALTAAIGFLVLEVLIRRVPSRRPARPRRIVLPPWRPG